MSAGAAANAVRYQSEAVARSRITASTCRLIENAQMTLTSMHTIPTSINGLGCLGVLAVGTECLSGAAIRACRHVQLSPPRFNTSGAGCGREATGRT